MAKAEPAQSGRAVTPPQTVHLKWCPTCGRHDQFRFLATRHKPSTRYDGTLEKGGICPGRVVVLTYRLDPVESAYV